MATPAVRWPPPVGLKTTLMVQLMVGARVGPQVLVWLKSAALVPGIAMLVMFSVALPVLVMVTGSAGLDTPTRWLLNTRLAGASVMAGALAPWRGPVPVGWKVTRMLQLARAASPVPQLFVCAKSPLATMLKPVRASAALVFFSVTVWAVLCVPTGSLAKFRLGVDKVTIGAEFTLMKRETLLLSGLGSGC